MNFGEALELLKSGYKVCRRGWNGKDMFIWIKPATVIKEEWCHDETLKKLANKNGGTIYALGTICLKTANNQILTGWLASQEDMLSEDWMIYPENVTFTNDFNFNDSDWDNIPEDEKVTSKDLEDIIEDDRFNNAVDSATEKIHGLRSQEVDANKVISDLKKEFKMGDEYSAPKRDEIQLFKAEVQNVGTQVLRMVVRDDRLDFLKSAKEELLASADTEEKKLILEENFELFEDYVKNH